jgi:hypothetical protein
MSAGKVGLGALEFGLDCARDALAHARSELSEVVTST